MGDSVTLKQIDDQIIASIRKEQPQDDLGPFVSSSAISLLVYAKEKGVSVAGRGFVIYHSQGENVDMEVCLPVSKSAEDRGDIKFRDIKGGKAASLIHKGIWENLPQAHERLRKWAKDNSHPFKEVREVFLKGPQETKVGEEYETELLYL